MCPENIDKYVFYKAVLIVIEQLNIIADRFSLLAQEMAENAQSHRKDELIRN